MKKLKYVVENLAAGKNVFITGSIGSGKTTLFKKVLAQLADYTLIETSKNGTVVELFYESEQTIIGRVQNGRMSSCPAGFDLALTAVERFLQSADKLLAIDEVGFLEVGRDDYLDLLIKSGQQRKVLAVLRKNNHALLKDLDRFQPFVLIDLDAFT